MLVLLRRMPFNGSTKNSAKVSRSKITQLLRFFFLCFREKLAANTAPTANTLALCGCPTQGVRFSPFAQFFCVLLLKKGGRVSVPQQN